MMSPRQIVVKGFLLGVLAAVLGAGAFFVYVASYTGTDRILPGVVVGPVPVGGLRTGEARARVAGASVWPQPVQAQLSQPMHDQGEAQLKWEEKRWPVRLREIEAGPDVPGAVKAALGIGRTGTLWDRSFTFFSGFVHGHYVPLEPAVKEQALINQLQAIAKVIHRSATDAQYDYETDTLTEEVAGQELDLSASLDAARRAVLAGRPEVNLVVRPVPPTVRKEELAQARQYQIARFATPILAADPGRVHNIALAIKKIRGVVVKPDQVFSFNDVVGPRDATNGWAPAKELYQGEFVLGYGGGICQVSSTLYNAVLLAGLEIKQRHHHDRPLQYIAPGRDATVAWKALDFKFRNSTGVPVLLDARVIPGAPQQIEVTLFAPNLVPEGSIQLDDSVVRYYPPELEELPDRSLPAHVREVVDEGFFGIEVQVFRVFKDGHQVRRELVSHDNYRPKAGKVRVGVGNAPGSEKLLQPGLR